MIEDILFDGIQFLLFEKEEVLTGQIESIELNGGSTQSSINVASGEIFI